MSTFFFRLALVGFVLASATCGFIVWIHPLSMDFIVRAAIIGILGFSLTTAYYRWDFHLGSLPLLLLIILVLMGGGFYWSIDHAFGSAYHKTQLWILSAEYFSTTITVWLGLWSGLLGLRSTRSRDETIIPEDRSSADGD
jgi:hypothetical protein